MFGRIALVILGKNQHFPNMVFFMVLLLGPKITN